MRKKYLISCDLDESLLKTNKTISLRTKLYIRKLVKKGHIFMINTGRPYQSALHFYKMLKIKNMPISGLNGTQITFLDENYERVNYIPFGFEQNLFRDFINEVKDYLVGAHVEDINQHYLLKGYIPVWLDNTHVGIKKDFVDDFASCIPSEPLLANLYLKKEDAHIFDKVLAKEKYKIFKNEVWEIGDGLISYEIHDRNINKASSMLYMANYYGIPKEDIIAFGDNQNDIEMLSEAGVGVAMCNGLESVKKLVKHITKKDNNHNGIADYLRRLNIK